MSRDALCVGYAPVNGLRMYYEIHGAGRPLVMLHGSFMSVELMGALVPELAKNRQLIAVEFQGHGHTGDIDRPITYEHLADDTAALLRHLQFDSADVFGYSLGGGTALQLGIRHPEVVRKLVVASAAYGTAGLHPEAFPAFEQLAPEMFDGPWREAYNRVAPNVDAFPTLVAKLKRLHTTPYNWPADDIRSIEAPTLIVAGDSDGARPEHTVSLFQLLGGGVFGDLVGLPSSQLAILPGTTHVGLLERATWLAPMISEFLDAPMPESA